MTTTHTFSSTFTITHAKYLASKIASDLLQMQLFYGQPSDSKIDNYIEEVVILLLGGYLKSVDYGFQKDSKWVIALRYDVRSDGSIADDSRSGRVPPGVNISGASWYSYLCKSTPFWRLSQGERTKIEQSLPILRTAGTELKTTNGAWSTDRSYSSGGVGMQRHTFKPF